MKLTGNTYKLWFIPCIILSLGLGISLGFKFIPTVLASSDPEEVTYQADPEDYFVTVYDEGEKTIVKTTAATVEDLLGRMSITYSDYDIIEPKLDTPINSDNFYINIHRARPVVLKDGKSTIYAMTASRDPRSIYEDAGLTVYDGDEINLEKHTGLSEVGLAETYSIVRNGGRTITVTEEIPFAEETVKDYNIPLGSSELRQLGELGSRTLVYEVNYVDGVETERTLVSEVVTKESVPRITAVGVKQDVPPEWETCAGWARQAGVSEADLYAALTLIYHESGCRVSAQNASSGAYGIGQALPGSKMAKFGADWETNPVTQIKWMASYVNGRYGGWRPALNFWEGHHWY